MTDKIPFPNLASAQSHHASSARTGSLHHRRSGQPHCCPRPRLACHLGFWREQVPMLADQARLILIDLPGHGQSDKPQTNYTMDFFAGAVVRIPARCQSGSGHVHWSQHGRGRDLQRVSPGTRERFPRWSPWMACSAACPQRRRNRGRLWPASHRLDILIMRRHSSAHCSRFPAPRALRASVMAEMLDTPQHVMLGGMTAMMSPEQPDWICRRSASPS